MSEITMKKYCGILMFDIPTPSFTNSKSKPSSQLTIDYTTSLENSNIRTQDNFIYTSYMEPMKVNPQRPHKNTPITLLQDSSKNNETTMGPLYQEKRTRRPPNSFILYRRAKQPEIIRQYGKIPNAEKSRILSDLWHNESNEVKKYWQNLADKKKVEYMNAPSEHCYPNKLKNPKRNGKLKVTDSYQFRNALPEIQTYDIVYPLPSEYIMTMDPTLFLRSYDYFENTNPTVLPSIFPKDDSYNNIINTQNDNAQ
ncbi:28696_t:CDS:1 [Gigaspora margarita]|uniref:28696_t:CDS:1 n=1 Tax=Gigaspora margarita TaxID=4874 RepID=A0ABM8W4J3_GIGMA|nr:28696_t:CDS:1 [Gigaspora margarita]